MLCEIAAAKSAYLSEHLIFLDIIGLFSFCLSTLPWLSDELKHDEEDKELDKDYCEHVYQELSL